MKENPIRLQSDSTEPNAVTAVGLMEALRDDGWCVVLKCLPKDIGWIVDGARSEYDAPSEDKRIGVGKWCCECQDVRLAGNTYRVSEFAMGDSPLEAVRAVWTKIQGRQ